MIINKPYHRCYRPVSSSQYDHAYSSWAYIIHKDYAKNPQNYTRAYLYLQKELETIFEYIEPSDCCLSTYSYKIHSLFMRVCIEIEANFKAILYENTYQNSSKCLNIKDYQKIDKSHKLSDYIVHLPMWNGNQNEFKPFSAWNNPVPNNHTLLWYQAYNQAKHNRHDAFKKANFENLLNAMCGLLVVISSQFQSQDFLPKVPLLALSGSCYNVYPYEDAIGGLFRIKYPTWQEHEKYNFNWENLKIQSDIFTQFVY
jgi:hypothetical protein